MPEHDKKLKETSEIFKALGHPSRLCIVHKLVSGNLNVSQMQECLNISQSNLSQHLTILKSKSIIEGNRKGSEVIYTLINSDVEKLINIYFD